MLQICVKWASQFRREPRWLFSFIAVFVFLSFSLFLLFDQPEPIDFLDNVDVDRVRAFALPGQSPDNTTWTVADYLDNAIQAPYQDKFWDFGQRCRRLSKWLSDADHLKKKSQARRDLLEATEVIAASLFPFLKHPDIKAPLSSLRTSFEKGSRGIVIPVGGGEDSIRYAGHLIASLRNVLGSKLPIQIAYAGEDDLPEGDRKRIASLDGARGVEFLDVLTVFNDDTLRLGEGGWAVKPFAALASRFEQVIVLDADAVFLQKAENLFAQKAYKEHGAYLFHDRLLWQHSFGDRHDWWVEQIKEPSPAMNKSLVWTEDYAEECDSGVVVLDKSRPEVLVGLLLIAWQNTYDVREEVTYKLTYGDKESWWLGLELAGSGYEFEEHYGSMLGWVAEDSDAAEAKVCSFVIAHTDEEDRLIWYNGSLLKNKLADPEDYDVPDHWMKDGKWQKGSKKEMSCMVDAEAIALTGGEKEILGRSIEWARRVDQALKQ